jgi:hypothetical protein
MNQERCLKCEESLDVYDLLTECPNCGFVMRLTNWEPLTLEAVEYSPIEEDSSAKERRIKYETEMAKIIHLDSASGITKTRNINISGPARALYFLRFMDYVMILNCGFQALALLTFFIYDPGSRQGWPLTFTLVVLPVLLFGVYTGYRHIGGIDCLVWRLHIIVFPLLLLFYILKIALNFLVLSDKDVLDTPTNFAILREIPYLFIYAALAISGLVSVLLLRRMRIALLGVPLTELLSSLRSQRSPRAHTSAHIKRLNKPLGIIVVGVGVGILLGNVFLLPLIAPLDTYGFYTIYGYLKLLSLLLLIRARQYFQINAESLLHIDKRKPILFLRSFDDEERQQYFPLTSQAILDNSLESRLSNHFNNFGPFIAIGSPDEAVPVPGAARVIMSDDEWLPRVTSWMSEAALIIMYSGKTDWVQWELAKLIEMGRIQNLILMIPEYKREDKTKDASVRIERLRDIFKNTKWSGSLVGLEGFQDLRALFFDYDGSLVVIKSRPRNRDSYHLAALVVHYIILSSGKSNFPLNNRPNNSLNRSANSVDIIREA